MTATSRRVRTLLDEVVPVYDVRSQHGVHIAAEPDRVYEVARHLDLGGPWAVRVLMGLRLGPARLAAAIRRTVGAPSVRRPAAGSISPFVVVAEEAGEEVVLGIMGQFWTPTGGLVSASASDFREPPPPGFAQGFWDFRVERQGLGTMLTTETRVQCADAATRRQFVRYWRVIRLGSGATRWVLLRSIRRQAERAAVAESRAEA